ncbi:MAG: xanthine dehydrogenase family protein [Rhodospirillaceae bacterium]|jgi:aerobic carbon-monoxide dehydrogenase large subunit|nr:xanthine dehydrogenase family protein [Rhodospirillaceae bacterium]MBT6117061.1 xanthine dehydrogenase family protein [Rhodospirillaceae bacterium]
MPRKYGFGQSVTRSEDPRFLTGRGHYTGDVVLPGMAEAHVLRAPFGHAEIKSIDTSAAKAAPGILFVATGEDVAAAGLGGIPSDVKPDEHAVRHVVMPVRPLLARDRVRFSGEGIALVVAETLEQARDAAELIEVEYDDLPAIADTAGAVAEGAPTLWPDAPDNVALEYRHGDPAAVEAGFARAAHVARVELIQNRVMGMPMEPMAAIGDYDSARERYELHCPSQGVHYVRRVLAERVFRVPAWAVHVITPDVGGGFGVRVFPTVEHALVLWAARRTGRPVRYVAERTESNVADVHARDHATTAELALDEDGRFLAVRVDTVAAVGAYGSCHGLEVPTTGYAATITGVYRTPVHDLRVRAVFTNTVPTDAYRGAGRPEAQYVAERLADAAADVMGLDRTEIRRRNLIPAEAMPFTTSTGYEIDSGDLPGALDKALALADADGFEARRAEAAKRGALRGLGIATYMKLNGGSPDELVEARFEEGGGLTLIVGSQNNGQGHDTMYAQLAADRLGVPFESVRVVQGDSELVTYGQGTGGSCALSTGGAAAITAMDKVAEEGKRFAGQLLEAAEADIEFAEGAYRVAGTDKAVTLAEVARTAFKPGPHTAELGFGLSARHLWQRQGPTFPNGCHVCEVEVDEDTGRVRIVAYSVIDDMGRIMNPMLVEGQVHGGVVQGIGQALLEDARYEAESGQFVAASLMDYCLPRADDLPNFRIAFHEVPCTTNPLGVKGVGEAGTTGSMPAVVGAVADALRGHGVSHIDMPLTSEKVWRAMGGA